MLGIFILLSLGTNIETSWTKYWEQIYTKSFVQLVSSWRSPWTWGYVWITNIMLLPVPEAVLSHNGADQLCSLSSVLLFAVPEAVSSLKEGRSRSAEKPILCVTPLYPRGSLVPYKSEEYHFCGALLTERTFFCKIDYCPGVLRMSLFFDKWVSEYIRCCQLVTNECPNMFSCLHFHEWMSEYICPCSIFMNECTNISKWKILTEYFGKWI